MRSLYSPTLFYYFKCFPTIAMPVSPIYYWLWWGCCVYLIIFGLLYPVDNVNKCSSILGGYLLYLSFGFWTYTFPDVFLAWLFILSIDKFIIYSYFETYYIIKPSLDSPLLLNNSYTFKFLSFFYGIDMTLFKFLLWLL